MDKDMIKELNLGVGFKTKSKPYHSLRFVFENYDKERLEGIYYNYEYTNKKTNKKYITNRLFSILTNRDNIYNIISNLRVEEIDAIKDMLNCNGFL